jgi:hypothetical protein
MAPELHNPECAGLERFDRTLATDIYAFACVCLEVRNFHRSPLIFAHDNQNRYTQGMHHFMRFEKILQ